MSRLLLQLLQHYSNEQGNCCNNWRVTAVSRVMAATECYINKPGNCNNWRVTAVSRVTAATECYISKPGNCNNWGVTAVSR